MRTMMKDVPKDLNKLTSVRRMALCKSYSAIGNMAAQLEKCDSDELKAGMKNAKLLCPTKPAATKPKGTKPAATKPATKPPTRPPTRPPTKHATKPPTKPPTTAKPTGGLACCVAFVFV